MKKIAHLIIAHPNPDSFNYALKKTEETYLQNLGYEVVVSDLYEMYQQNHAAVRPYGIKQSPADKADIKQEQNKIKQSELTIVQFPMFWFTFPGLMKNYFDTVWELGFAFGPGKFTQSPLHDGRKVLFSITTQSTEQDYTDAGSNGSINRIIFPMETAFKFIGFEILPPFVAYAVLNKSNTELQLIKTKLEQHLSHNLVI